MPSAKIAISLPDAVLRDVDEAARAGGESRSGYIARVLRTVDRDQLSALVGSSSPARLDEVLRGVALVFGIEGLPEFAGE